MRIRLDQELPPRPVASLASSFLLVLSFLFVLFLLDSGQGWVSTFFVKQVARIHCHQVIDDPYNKICPSFLHESIGYDPIDGKYIIGYNPNSYPEVVIRRDESVWVPQSGVL